MGAEDVFGIVGTTQAGNFKVERVVAEGGFGVVYRAQHGGFRAPVALKCLKVPEDMSQLQRNVFLEKFREEAELLFRLSAAIPEVVRPLHVDVLQQKDGRFVPFLAMEWLEGESLDQIITRRKSEGQAPIGLPKLVRMLKPLAVALSRSHHFQGPRGTEVIVHRDLKPENVFVATLGGIESVKVLDFGIAKAKRVATKAAGRLVESTTSLGLGPQEDAGAFTPGYGAPEQWAPKRLGETGPWTDVWGLALTMVEVLVGGPAIDGDTMEMRKLALDEKRRPSPQALGAPVPAEVERVFVRALAVDPRARYQDIASFWGDLEAAMGMPRSFPKQASGPAPSAPSSGPARLARIELQKRLVAPVSQPDADKAPNSAVFDFDFDDPPRPKTEPQVSAGTEEPLEASLEESLEESLDAPDASLEFDLGEPPPPVPVPVPAPARPAAPPPPRRALPSPAPAEAAELDLEVELPVVNLAPAPAPAPAPPSPPARAPAASAGAEFDLSSAFDVAPRRPAAAPAPRLDMDLAPAPPPRPGNFGRFRESVPPPAMSLGDRLKAPLGVLSLAIAISASDVVYTKLTGSPLMLGPARPFWIAAPLALAGVIFTILRLLGGGDG